MTDEEFTTTDEELRAALSQAPDIKGRVVGTEASVLPASELARQSPRDRLIDPIYWSSAVDTSDMKRAGPGSGLCDATMENGWTCTRLPNHEGVHQ